MKPRSNTAGFINNLYNINFLKTNFNYYEIF